ncbi:hypothetical protein NC653_036259 [Populus alba x Populus x berolinensis]|uniref:Uncharacterized protein n=1 Tax=Populus alba x Populus x berolinensis TaxID=444605 RepID=A0AAD6LJU2_9ROSI|nr:hypothetical protein NC653_036259 [Populus alba x Populus x berolinensis]
MDRSIERIRGTRMKTRAGTENKRREAKAEFFCETSGGNVGKRGSIFCLVDTLRRMTNRSVTQRMSLVMYGIGDVAVWILGVTCVSAYAPAYEGSHRFQAAHAAYFGSLTSPSLVAMEAMWDLVKIRDHHGKERRNCGVKAYKFNVEFSGILNNKIRLKSSCQLYRRKIKISTSNYLIFCRPTEKTAMVFANLLIQVGNASA